MRKTPGLLTARQTSVGNGLTSTFGKRITTLKFAISVYRCWQFLGCPDRRKLSKAFSGVLLQLSWAPCLEGMRTEGAFPFVPVDVSWASFWNLINHTIEICSHIFRVKSTRKIHIQLSCWTSPHRAAQLVSPPLGLFTTATRSRRSLWLTRVNEQHTRSQTHTHSIYVYHSSRPHNPPMVLFVISSLLRRKQPLWRFNWVGQIHIVHWTLLPLNLHIFHDLSMCD